MSRNGARMGDLSANFSRREFRCACCRVEHDIDPNLVLVLQRARNWHARPLRVISGYRCARQNTRVGGHPASQHRHGRAADVEGHIGTAEQWRAWGAVGIGIRNGRVIHVDVTPGRRSFTFAD